MNEIKNYKTITLRNIFKISKSVQGRVESKIPTPAWFTHVIFVTYLFIDLQRTFSVIALTKVTCTKVVSLRLSRNEVSRLVIDSNNCELSCKQINQS